MSKLFAPKLAVLTMAVALASGSAYGSFDSVAILDGFKDIRANHPGVLAENLQKVIDATRNRTPERLAQAILDNDNLEIKTSRTSGYYYSTSQRIWITPVGPNLSDALGGLGDEWAAAKAAGELTKTMELITRTNVLGLEFYSPATSNFANIRPFKVSPDVVHAFRADGTDLTGTTTAFSFPSGHTTWGYGTALAMATLLPERYAELIARAADYGHSRIILGVHYPLDVMGGRIGGTVASTAFLNDPAMAQLIEEAQAEVRRVLERRCGMSIADCADAGTTDAYADAEANQQRFTEYLTYGFGQIGEAGKAMVVPVGAEALLATRFPYLSAGQRREILRSTALDSGYPLDIDGESWQRLNLYAASQGFGELAADTRVVMDAARADSSRNPFHAQDTWSNDIGGAGRLIKAGSGQLQLSGINTFAGVQVEDGELQLSGLHAFSGASQVSGGTLRVDGLLQSDQALTVGASGRLTGSGVIASDMQIDGTLDLSSATPMTALGAINLGRGSRFNVTADSSPQPFALTRALVASPALTLIGPDARMTLGGTLSAGDSEAGTLIATLDGATVSGRFDGIQQSQNLLAQGLRHDVGFSAAGLQLLVSSAYLPGQLGLSGNALAGATLLNGLRDTSLGVSNSQYNQWLQNSLATGSLGGLESQVGGQLHGDSLDYLLDQPKQLNRTLSAQLFADRQLPSGQGRLWGAALNDNLTHDGAAGAKGSKGNTQGALVGYSHRLNDNLQVAGMFGQSQGDVSTGNAKADVDVTQLGLSLRYSPAGMDQGLYAEGQLTSGYIDYSSARKLGQFGEAKGDSQGWVNGATLSGGYVAHAGGWRVNPELSLQSTHVRLDGFTEQHSELALQVDGMSETRNSLLADLRLGRDLNVGDWLLTPSLSVGYERVLNDAQVDSQALLLGLPVEQQSARDTKNLYRVGLDLDLAQGAWSLSGSLDGLKGGDSSGGGASLKLGYAF
ncbi:autotransporter domain-containing protein [Pseudomonas cavernae]|uniref:Autotransporter domain-containing protein n=1 Tax=Pseudomonas cavernae TaxID=2320867 RepID=A0A385YWF1_9PSED|nr:autotransporter domain-containing protein [Pseudomonas cavernae]AYC31026.1 autotransporter domain-containing protein [Pseudomonas cavernae]